MKTEKLGHAKKRQGKRQNQTTEEREGIDGVGLKKTTEFMADKTIDGQQTRIVAGGITKSGAGPRKKQE